MRRCSYRDVLEEGEEVEGRKNGSVGQLKREAGANSRVGFKCKIRVPGCRTILPSGINSVPNGTLV